MAGAGSVGRRPWRREAPETRTMAQIVSGGSREAPRARRGAGRVGRRGGGRGEARRRKIGVAGRNRRRPAFRQRPRRAGRPVGQSPRHRRPRIGRSRAGDPHGGNAASEPAPRHQAEAAGLPPSRRILPVQRWRNVKVPARRAGDRGISSPRFLDRDMEPPRGSPWRTPSAAGAPLKSQKKKKTGMAAARPHPRPKLNIRRRLGGGGGKQGMTGRRAASMAGAPDNATRRAVAERRLPI